IDRGILSHTVDTLLHLTGSLTIEVHGIIPAIAIDHSGHRDQHQIWIRVLRDHWNLIILLARESLVDRSPFGADYGGVRLHGNFSFCLSKLEWNIYAASLAALQNDIFRNELLKSDLRGGKNVSAALQVR